MSNRGDVRGEHAVAKLTAIRAGHREDVARLFGRHSRGANVLARQDERVAGLAPVAIDAQVEIDQNRSTVKLLLERVQARGPHILSLSSGQQRVVHTFVERAVKVRDAL